MKHNVRYIAMVNILDVKKLRDRTGISVMQCREALEEAQGDTEKAIIILKRKGSQIAAKKSKRELKAGVITSYIHLNGNIGVLIELLCETDFVAKNEEFKHLADDIAMQIAAMDPVCIQEKDLPQKDSKEESELKERVLLLQPFIKESEITVREMIEQSIQKLGEKIEVSRFTRYLLLK